MNYQKYVDNGDIILIDAYQVTHEDIIRYIVWFVNKYKSRIKKIGLDPTNIKELESYFNNATGDNKFCIPVYSQKTMWNTPRIENIQRLRADKKVYCNNNLDIVQNANTVKKIDSRGLIFLDTLEKRKHNDAIYAELALETAIETYLNAESKNNGMKLNSTILKNGYLNSKINYDIYKEDS